MSTHEKAITYALRKMSIQKTKPTKAMLNYLIKEYKLQKLTTEYCEYINQQGEGRNGKRVG